MGTKATYDKAKVLEIIAEYFFAVDEEMISDKAFEKIYDEIKDYAKRNYPQISMPKFSQMRKILIEHLSQFGEYASGEKLTTSVALRIRETYINSDKIEDIIEHGDYHVSIHAQRPIICTIKLPDPKLLEALAEGISKEKKHSLTWGKINLINKICQRIKKKNPDLILAVIPEFNKMVYLTEEGKISKSVDKNNPVCNSLCMFVKNTDEGRNLIMEMRNLPFSH